MDLLIIFIILFTHWFGDFVMQTEKMADNKSKSFYWLSLHSISYTIGVFILLFLANTISLIEINTYLYFLEFTVLNGIAHMIVDFFTSKWARRLREKNKIRGFFQVIGFDQLCHIMTLLITFNYFNSF